MTGVKLYSLNGIVQPHTCHRSTLHACSMDLAQAQPLHPDPHNLQQAIHASHACKGDPPPAAAPSHLEPGRA